MPQTKTKHEVFAEAVVRVLKDERERQGLAMLAVAERAGLSQQIVSYVERGIRKMSFDSFLRITDALGLEPAEVLRKARSGQK